MTLRKLRKEIIELWPFGLVLVVGGALHYYPHHWWLGELISGGLSEATMIAAILGGTVDKLAKKELMRELSVDLWFQFTGRDLPAAIKTFIKKALIETDVVATGHELRYTFVERPDGRLDVVITMRRRLENFSSRKAVLPHHTSVFLVEEPDYLEYTCEVEGRPKRSFSWPNKPKKSKAHFVTERGALVFDARSTTLAPFGEPGSVATIIRRTKHVFRAQDTDIHAHGKATTATTIIVDRKPEWLDFQVDPKEAVQSGSTWTIDSVMWAGGFRRVRWFDRREKPSGPTSL